LQNKIIKNQKEEFSATEAGNYLNEGPQNRRNAGKPGTLLPAPSPMRHGS